MRSAVIDYRDTPNNCDGQPSPLGAARRIIRYVEKLRYGRLASRNRVAEVDYFAAISTYGELTKK